MGLTAMLYQPAAREAGMQPRCAATPVFGLYANRTHFTAATELRQHLEVILPAIPCTHSRSPRRSRGPL